MNRYCVLAAAGLRAACAANQTPSNEPHLRATSSGTVMPRIGSDRQLRVIGNDEAREAMQNVRSPSSEVGAHSN